MPIETRPFELGPVLIRTLEHIFMDGGFAIMSLLFFDWARRRKWLPTIHGLVTYLLAGVAALLLIYVREAFDVWYGQHIGKVWFDYIGHLSIFAWFYAIYRLAPRLEELTWEIKTWFGDRENYKRLLRAKLAKLESEKDA